MKEAATEAPRDEVWHAVVRLGRFVGRRARREYLVLIAGAILGLVGAFLYLMATPPYYSASAVLGPGNVSLGSGSGNLQFSALSSLTGGGNNNDVTAFDKFRATLVSVLLAEHMKQNDEFLRALYSDQWDSATHSWRQPSGLSAWAKGGIRNLLGRSAWLAPDDVQIANVLQRRLAAKYDRLSGLLTITFTAKSPAVAQTLLSDVIDESDSLVRRQAQHDAERYVGYAAEQLRTVTNAEMRAALTNVEQEHEKVVVLAGVNVPFSVTVIDPPKASLWAAGPSVPLAFGLGFLIGLILGLALALIWPEHRPLAAPIRERLVAASARWL